MTGALSPWPDAVFGLFRDENATSKTIRTLKSRARQFDPATVDLFLFFPEGTIVRRTTTGEICRVIRFETADHSLQMGYLVEELKSGKESFELMGYLEKVAPLEALAEMFE